jgi:cysteine desulfurase
MIYLDYNATTPVHPEVRQKINVYLEAEYGNPSSSHAKGRAAKAAIDEARIAVASLIGASPSEIIFTGSATEANNLAVIGACMAAPAVRKQVLVSAIEHPAVLEPAHELQRRGWRLHVVPVDREGRLELDALRLLLASGDTALVSVMHANNELGTVQPIEDIGRLVKQHGALFHVDAAQAIGKIAVNVDTMQADLLTIAGHKMYAPKGIGALYIRRGTRLQPLLFGASQEGALRPSTENVPYIAGLGAASKIVAGADEARARMARLRDELQASLIKVIPGLTVNGSQRYRLPNTLHVSLPEGSARSLIALLANEVALSPGAACHADSADEPSGVMKAIGATAQQTTGAIRISLGYDTTPEEVQTAVRAIANAYGAHRSATASALTANALPDAG